MARLTARTRIMRALAIAMIAALPVTVVAGDVVQFTFRWPERFSAQVESTKSLQRTGLHAQQDRATVRYRYDVTPDRGALRISIADFAVAVDGPGAGWDATSEPVLTLGSMMPSYRVSRSGEFLGVEDLARVQRDARALFASVLPADLDAEARGRVERFADELLSEASLNEVVAEEWNVLVEAWKDVELEIGETYGSDTEGAIELFGNVPLHMNVEVDVLRRLPCQRGTKQRKCVEVELVSTLDPKDVERLGRRVAEQLSGKEAAEKVDGLVIDLTHRINIVLEPDGMLPHRYSLVEALHVREPSKPQSEAVSERKETAVEFRYD